METWQEWRKKKRIELLARREAVASSDRIQWSIEITNSLDHGFPILWKSTVGSYWPYRGEYDPRPAMNCITRNVVRFLRCLQVESERKLLCFRRWWKEAPMKMGAYNIPVTDNTEPVMVNAVIVPMLGFDMQGYRLGYGGGYYDRTIIGIESKSSVNWCDI